MFGCYCDCGLVEVDCVQGLEGLEGLAGTAVQGSQLLAIILGCRFPLATTVVLLPLLLLLPRVSQDKRKRGKRAARLLHLPSRLRQRYGARDGGGPGWPGWPASAVSLRWPLSGRGMGCCTTSGSGTWRCHHFAC